MKTYDPEVHGEDSNFASGERLATVLEMARQMTEPGLDSTSVSAAIRNVAKNDLIHSFGLKVGSGKTAHRLYREDQWLIAKVLVTVMDCGIRDLDVSRAVALKLSAWDMDDAPGLRESGNLPEGWPRSPAQMIIDEFRASPHDWSGWILNIRWLRGDQSGRRVIDVQLLCDDHRIGGDASSEMVPACEMVMSLDRFLPRLLVDKDKAN